MKPQGPTVPHDHSRPGEGDGTLDPDVRNDLPRYSDVQNNFNPSSPDSNKYPTLSWDANNSQFLWVDVSSSEQGYSLSSIDVTDMVEAGEIQVTNLGTGSASNGDFLAVDSGSVAGTAPPSGGNAGLPPFPFYADPFTQDFANQFPDPEIDSPTSYAWAKSSGLGSFGSAWYALNGGTELISYNFFDDYIVTPDNQQETQSLTDITGTGLTVQPDGSAVIIVGTDGDGNDIVRRLPMSSSWDITSISNGAEIDVTATCPGVSDVDFSPSGDRMFLSSETNGNLVGYILATDFDPSTATQVSNANVPLASPRGISFSESGGLVYAHDLSTIYSLYLFEDYSFNDVVTASSFSFGESTDMQAARFGLNDALLVVLGADGMSYSYFPNRAGGVQNPLTEDLDLAGNALLNGTTTDVLTFGSGGEPRLHNENGVITATFTSDGSGNPVVTPAGDVRYGGTNGPLSWVDDISEVSSNTNIASAARTYLVDTSGGNVTMTLPTGVSTGWWTRITKTASGNTLTIDRNGANIDGSASNIDLSAQGATERLTIDSSGNWWTE